MTQPLRSAGICFTRFMAWPLVVAVAVGIALPHAAGQPTPSANRTQDGPSRPAIGAALEDSSTDGQAKALLREGTVVSELEGHFVGSGESAEFVTTDGHRLGGLKSLSLQRVTRALRSAENAQRITWKLSGVITEYEGRNFILIKRAIQKTRHRRALFDDDGKPENRPADPAERGA